MSSASTTNKPEGDGRAAETDRQNEAERLVGEADALIAEVLSPGRWPQKRTVESFLRNDRLDRVLALYGRAMRLDPEEAAYPWNLASTLNRLGINDLALGLVSRAIRVAALAGEDDWSGADAHVAMAEIAIDAGEPEIALTALTRSVELNGAEDRSSVERVLAEIRRTSGQENPQVSLAIRLLDRLPA